MLLLMLKWLHIVAAIVAVGANLTYGVWFRRVQNHPGSLPFVLKGIEFLDSRIANPAYGVLLVTGLAMVFVSGLPLTTPWLAVSLGLYLAAFLLGVFVVTPGFRRQIELAGKGLHNGQEYRGLARRGAIVGIGLSALVLVITFLMVIKPSLW